MIGKKNESMKKEEKNYVICPSCGKRVPDIGSCNKCGSSLSLRDRLTIKKIHIYILVMALIGGGLMVYAYYKATYITPIGDINPGMDGQVIRVSGTIVDVDFDSRYEKASFTVNDSSGSIDFYGWSDFTSDLRESSTIPGIGDKVIVEGAVDVYNSSYSGLITSLVVENVDSIEYLPMDTQEMDIGEISLDDVGIRVKIEGEVVSRYLAPIDSQYGQFMRFTVSQNNENITAYVNSGQIGLADEALVYPELGDQVEVTGVIDEYHNEVEIIPSTATEQSIEIIEV
ncbi:MAG: hypothetical protein ACOC44_03440 [Promethearchaeia archaeon]